MLSMFLCAKGRSYGYLSMFLCAKGRSYGYLSFPVPREGVVVIYIIYNEEKNCGYLYSPMPRERVMLICISIRQGKELWLSIFPCAKGKSYGLCQGKELWLSLFPYAKGRSYGYFYSPTPRDGVMVISIPLCQGKEFGYLRFDVAY